jgi:hypothetical protein
MPRISRWGVVSLAVTGLVIGAVVGFLLNPCPEDEWPHQAFTGGGAQARDLLEEIVDQGLDELALDDTPDPTKDKIKEALHYALKCAWQDLPDQTSAEQAQHLIAVQEAHTAATGTAADKWDTVADKLGTIGVDHPH